MGWVQEVLPPAGDQRRGQHPGLLSILTGTIVLSSSRPRNGYFTVDLLTSPVKDLTPERAVVGHYLSLPPTLLPPLHGYVRERTFEMLRGKGVQSRRK